ncbi:MAG: phenylacetate--CoA ligase family protein [Candidatus Freyarchaeota archaeon]|nr:phenylacetate--CoA ligase family protein [Candidatus Jordarchaeia archaeon]MBS7269294.1 phenylacetate--CoA ligase family protein [Candidatus Jordarchaeia archaeon]MBS7280089.1 phenylacetate--CoA ligase family protein [Candidatus Jordarchaeia archaeon]
MLVGSELDKFWNRKIETMPREEIEELQLKRIKAEVNYAYHNTPFYKKSFKEAGVTPEDIKTINDFDTKVPLLYKDDLRAERSRTGDPFGGLLSVPLNERVKVINASTGTTGVPSVFAYTNDDWIMAAEQETRLKWMRGWRPKDLVFATGIRWHGYVVISSTGLDIVNITGISDCMYPLPHIAKRHVIEMKYMKPQIFAGPMLTMSAIFEAAKKMGEDIKKLFSSVRLIDTGYGEIVTKTVKRRIEAETGVPPERIFDFGGVADPLWYFGDCEEHAGNHQCDDLFYTRAFDLETHEPLASGERGEIVVTNLFAEATPMLKWGTEDTGFVVTEKCGCGRTHTRSTILGREAFAANIKGMRVFPADIENILGDIPGFTEWFTMLKYSKGPMDTLKLKMATDKDKVKDPEEYKREVKRKLKEKLDVDSEVEIVESVSDLPFVGHKVVKLLDMTKESK